METRLPPNIDLGDFAAALSSLPKRPRLVFCLIAVERLDYYAVAAELGVTIDEAERELARAFRLLARKLSRTGFWSLLPMWFR